MRNRNSLSAALLTALLLAITSTVPASNLMPPETFGKELSFPSFQWTSPLHTPSQTVVPRSDPFPPVFSQAQPMWLHPPLPQNGTKFSPMPWANVPSPDQSRFAVYGQTSGGMYIPMVPAPAYSPTSPTTHNHAPLPMVSWLLGAGIFGIIGFSRKP